MKVLLDRISFWNKKLDDEPVRSAEDGILVTNRRNFLGLVAGAAAFATVKQVEAVEAILAQPELPAPVAVSEGNFEIMRNGAYRAIGYVHSLQLPSIEPVVHYSFGQEMRRPGRMSNTIKLDLMCKYEGANICHDIMHEMLDPRIGNSRFNTLIARMKMFGIEYQITNSILTSVNTEHNYNEDWLTVQLELLNPQVTLNVSER